MTQQTQQLDLSGAAVGDVVAERTVALSRDSLVRYAGASNDFNPIHYRDDVAAEVGLPGVLAHGMLTMGLAVQPVVDALGDPGRIVGYRTKFTKPVVVDPQDGAEVTIVATVGALADADGIGRIDLAVTCAGEKVLGRAQVRARFASGAARADEAPAAEAEPSGAGA